MTKSLRVAMRLLVMLLCLCLWLGPAAAQDAASRPPSQVFMTHNVDAAGSDQLTFIDMLTGEQTSVIVNGERYTAAGDGILFFDLSERRAKVALPGGEIINHPFITVTAATRRVDWRVSPDGRLIAWTNAEGSPNALTTITTIASIDGRNAVQVLVDGPRDGIRAMPVAVPPDGALIYMDYQPDTIGDLTPFRQYAGLFSANVATRETAMLPGEPGCFCGGAVGSGYFVRLALTDDLRGFNVVVRSLAEARETVIPALSLVGYTQAGDVLISGDGRYAVYALAQVSGFGSAGQSVRTVFVLVDLSQGTQTALTEPTETFLRPIAWTDDHNALLLTSPTQDGTWKVNLSDGEIERVAAATYIGVVR